MKTRVFFSMVVVTCMAGCTLGPDYRRPEVAVPAQHRDAVPPAPGAEASSLAGLKWFELFQDEQLQALIRTTLAQNYDLRIAVARVLEAQAQLGVTRSAQFPQIDGGASVGRERVSEKGFPALPGMIDPQGNTFLLNLTLFYEVDLWGRLRRQTEAARAELLSSEWARRAVLITLVSEVARAYFELRETDFELDIVRRTAASRERSLELIRLRQEQGVDSGLEVQQASSLLYTATARIPELERLMTQTENELSLLLAQPPGAIVRGRTLTAQPVPPAIPAGLPSALLDRRPDIVAAESLLVAANAQIGAAKALYFPSISLTGLLGVRSAELDQLATAPALTWSVAADALQPIFNAGRIRSLNAATQARYLQFLAQYEQTIQTAFREVSDALVGYHKTREQRTQQELLVQALQANLALANERFFGGVDSYLQVLNAERDLFDAELTLAQIRRNELLNLVRLYKALGGGWDSEEVVAGARPDLAARVLPAPGP
jgi:outer membrane protein, multidrug efflux system